MSWLNDSIMSDDGRVIKVAQEYAKAEQAYLKKFGEDSLERVLEIPHPITSSVLEYKKSASELMERAEKNQPFEQISEENWSTIAF